jgi:hypothetical protein
MYWDGEANQLGKRVVADLTPYRRLIELQKEMIELSQQHEHSKRQHDALRKQVARELEQLVRRRTSLGHRLRRSTARFITRLPGFAMIPIALKTINPKPS